MEATLSNRRENEVSDGMEEETDGVEEETDGIEKLTIIGVADVMETTSTILNTSSSNGTVALRRSLLCHAQYFFL